jgi:hypothetical protein
LLPIGGAYGSWRKRNSDAPALKISKTRRQNCQKPVASEYLYRVSGQQVVSGGVTAANNKFILGSANVEIGAVFEIIPTTHPLTIHT